MLTEKIKCPICNSQKTEYQQKFRNNHHCFSNLNRIACLECEFQFANPMPEIKKLEEYNSNYHESAHGGLKRNLKEQAFFTGLAKTRLIFIKENSELINKYAYNILEIGPGPGAFAKVWMDSFPNSNYFAIESDTSCHKELKNQGVNILSTLKHDFEIKFDFLIISHVLEHVPNPMEFLSPFIKQLKKGGYLFIEIPCMDWRHKDIDEPHLLFFDKASIEVLLSKLNLISIKTAYYGTLHKYLLNPFKIFFKRIRSFLWSKGFTYYHPEKKKLDRLLKDDLQTQALLNFDAHKEQINPSWWLRVLSKK